MNGISNFTIHTFGVGIEVLIFNIIFVNKFIAFYRINVGNSQINKWKLLFY